MDFLDIIRNTIDYPLRQFFRWRRPGLKILNEPKDDIFRELPKREREQALRITERLYRDYQLTYLFNHSTIRNYCENLYYLELLEKVFNMADIRFSDSIHVADVGVSNWFYAQAYHAFFNFRQEMQPNQNPDIMGYEIDPYRVYFDFYSRYDYATVYLEGLDGIQYYPKGFYRQPNRFDVVSLLFPFILKQDHLEWGLPAQFFQPLKLLVDVWESLKLGGILLVVNQGEKEHNEQISLLSRIGVRPIVDVIFDTSTYRYKIPRYVLLAVKNG